MYKNVFIDIRKLRDYCLNHQHTIGKHKAKVFASIFGNGRKDAKMLKEIIMAKMENADVLFAYEDPFGKRFIADLDIHINNGNALVRTIWIIKNNSSIPELVTCYVMI